MLRVSRIYFFAFIKYVGLCARNHVLLLPAKDCLNVECECIPSQIKNSYLPYRLCIYLHQIIVIIALLHRIDVPCISKYCINVFIVFYMHISINI